MATSLSDKAQAFLTEKHHAVLSTINKDGSPQSTTVWYFLADDGTIVMNSQLRLQKVKNMQRDPRIALCIEDGDRYVSINGTVELIEDTDTIRYDLSRLIQRYKDEEEARQQYMTVFMQQQRVALHLKCEKVKEYFS